MDRLRLLFAVFLVAILAGITHPLAQTSQTVDVPDLNAILNTIAERAQKFTNEIRGMAWTELITVEELDDNFRRKGTPKEYRYEAIVVRQPSPGDSREPRLVASRELKAVDGKPASQAELKRGKCRDTNPSPVYGMPLAFLLMPERARYTFTPVGEEEINGVKTLVVSAALTLTNQVPPKPEARVDNGCFSLVGVPPPEARLWIDREKGEVLQVTWRQPRPLEFSTPAGLNWKGPVFVFRPGRQLRLERQESRTRFERVSFDEPEQIALLPAESESLTFISGTGSPGLKTTTRYTQFKRFLTDVRVKETQ